MPVLLAARNLIHDGWRLLHHPLYGNFRPYQQPYRSLLLKFEPASVTRQDGILRVTAHEQSLHYLEEALSLFQGVKILAPDETPQVYLDYCSVLDFELMRLPLEQVGWPM